MFADLLPIWPPILADVSRRTPELLDKLKAGEFTLKHMSKDTQPASLIITVRERQRESGVVILKPKITDRNRWNAV